MEKIVLIGFGGHARSVADSIGRTGQYEIVGYTDIRKANDDNGYAYLGTDDDLAKIFESGIHMAVVAVGQIDSSKARRDLYAKLKDIGFELPIIRDPSAIVSDNCIIGEGTFIGKRAVINSNSAIGKMCIINTGAICEHDNAVGDFCHIAVGAVCCGGVKVGAGTFIGANATLIQEIETGDNVIVGAGSLVRHNISSNEKRYGIV